MRSKLIKRPTILKTLSIVENTIYTNGQVAEDILSIPRDAGKDIELCVTEQSRVWLETSIDNKLKKCGYYVDVSHLRSFTEIAALLRRCDIYTKISFSIRDTGMYTYNVGYFKLGPNRWVMIKNSFTVHHSKWF